MDIAEFLLARIAEDETDPPNPATWTGCVDGLSDADWLKIDAEESAWEKRWAAECAAKRRIVEEMTEALRWESLESWERVLQLLALPYADHPDFQPEWSPRTTV